MLLLMVLLAYLPIPGNSSSIGMGLGLGGGLALELYAKKHIEDWKQRPTKRIWKPLLICLAIFVPLLTLMIFALENPPVE
jgi:hypothetical protein